MRKTIVLVTGIVTTIISGFVFANEDIIFGTVVLEDGNEITGSIRWDEEEYLWIQQFNGKKHTGPDLSKLSAKNRNLIEESIPGPQVEVFGLTVEFVKWLGDSEIEPNEFAVRFGSIRKMDFKRDELLELTLHNGKTMLVEGGSNDFDTDIIVIDTAGSESKLDWDDIDLIHFENGPANAVRFDDQLFGTVTTEFGTFSGQVVWDKDERFGDEQLDWEEGDNEKSADFKQIKRISKLDDGSRISLISGEELDVDGTNDVNDENRGLYVIGADFGFANIPWSAFISVEFHQPVNVAAQKDFTQESTLRADVQTQDRQYENIEVSLDLDRNHTAESLFAKVGTVRLNIPLSQINQISINNDQVAIATISGNSYPVSMDSVNKRTPYLLLLEGDQQQLLAWKDIREINFKHH